jgi:LysM repeat protein
MKLRVALQLAVLALASLAAVASAGIEKAGTTAGNFLSVGTSPAALAMGGAGLARPGDLGLATWNVGSLAWMNETQLTFSHASLAAESQQEWAAAGGRWNQGAWRWALTGLYQGDGSFEGRDALGNSTGSFSASSMAVGGMLARPIGEHAGAGLGVKWVSESLGDVSGSGFSIDAGITAQAGQFSFAAAAQNALGSMSYSGASYPFPSNYGVGVAMTVPKSGVTLALDANFPDAYYTDVRAGAEWRYQDYVALRGGYRLEMGAESGDPLSGPTFGLGAGSNGFWLDYGYIVSGGGAGGQHRLGVTFHPGGMNPSSQTSIGSTRPSAPSGEPKARKSDSVKLSADAAKAAAAKAEAAKAEAAKVEAAKLEAARIEAAKVEAAKRESAKAEAAKAEAAKLAALNPEAAKLEAAKAEAAKRAAAKAEAAKLQAPKAEAAKLEAAKAEAAKLEVAKAEAARAEAAKLEAAKLEAASAEAARADAARLDATKVETAKLEAAKAEAAKAEAAKAQAAKLEAAKPEAPKPAEVVAEAPKLAPIVVKTPDAPKKSEPAVTKPVVRPAKVKVKSGESMADIAKRWETSVAAIMMENNLVSEKVKNGQQLKLPPAIKK